MSLLDNSFVIGKVAFGNTDYLELSAYFSIILGIYIVIYYQLFQSVKLESISSRLSPVEAYPVQTVTIIEGILCG